MRNVLWIGFAVAALCITWAVWVAGDDWLYLTDGVGLARDPFTTPARAVVYIVLIVAALGIRHVAERVLVSSRAQPV